MRWICNRNLVEWASVGLVAAAILHIGAAPTRYSPAAYGNMYHHDDSDGGAGGQACGITLQDTYYEVDGQTAGDLKGWTYATGDLTAGGGSAGEYLFNVDVSFSGGAGTNTYDFSVSINDVKKHPCDFERKTATQNVGAAGTNCVLAVADSDVVKLEVANLTGTADCTIWDSSLTLVRVD